MPLQVGVGPAESIANYKVLPYSPLVFFVAARACTRLQKLCVSPSHREKHVWQSQLCSDYTSPGHFLRIVAHVSKLFCYSNAVYCHRIQLLRKETRDLDGCLKESIGSWEFEWRTLEIPGII